MTEVNPIKSVISCVLKREENYDDRDACKTDKYLVGLLGGGGLFLALFVLLGLWRDLWSGLDELGLSLGSFVVVGAEQVDIGVRPGLASRIK